MIRIILFAVFWWLAAVVVLLAAMRLPELCGSMVAVVVGIAGLSSIWAFCEALVRYA